MSKQVLVSTLLDANNRNAQVNNCRELLTHWQGSAWQFTGFHYGDPDPRLLNKPHLQLVKLWRWRFWMTHIFSYYLRRYDIVFYPGVFQHDFRGLRWQRRLHGSPFVITTIEGLIGDQSREQLYSKLAGHQVYCQPNPPTTLQAIEQRYAEADHIIAISPFLQRLASQRYGDKCSMLPLGINTDLFFSAPRPTKTRPLVVTAGNVGHHKHPELFVQLAKTFPACDFCWYGDGPLRSSLQAQAATVKLTNLRFPGSLSAAELGAAFRQADVFVLPSRSEGVPKVTQEAAACGLPQVIFGFYEAPSVLDGHNGYVVWDDQQFITRVGELLASATLRQQLGAAGAELARAWAWPLVAQQWQHALQQIVETAPSRKR